MEKESPRTMQKKILYLSTEAGGHSATQASSSRVPWNSKVQYHVNKSLELILSQPNLVHITVLLNYVFGTRLNMKLIPKLV
jgi:hypothetical protein